MSEWINYKESPPPMKKREYWVYDAKNKRVTYDVFKHRVIKGGGIYADYGYCFSLILDNNASHYMPIVKGEGKPEPPKGGAGMSVVVRMEMPKACSWIENGEKKKCPISEWGGACAITKQFKMPDGCRPSWCPIICSLPEGHGRLVDADAYDYPGDLKWEPTIVPAEAERSEEDGK